MANSKIKFIFKVARPRFWGYLVGPFLVGWVFGLTKFNFADLDLRFWILLFTFLFPANLFVYGVNDLSDMDTDKENLAKKGTIEHLLKTDEVTQLVRLVLLALVWCLAVSMWIGGIMGTLIMIYLVLAGFYSVSPIRFKARAGWDFVSNIFYVIPGFVGYVYSFGQMPPVEFGLAAITWPMGMHLYSAVPDIKADLKARVITSAVKLGRGKSLLLVALLWSVTAVVFTYFTFGVGVLMFIYPLLALVSLKLDEKGLANMYWRFPVINMVLGLGYFVYGFLGKL